MAQRLVTIDIAEPHVHYVLTQALTDFRDGVRADRDPRVRWMRDYGAVADALLHHLELAVPLEPLERTRT